jgi:hypothetical protein
LILVDTKYELGRAPDGRILFIDEIHTPDSSRYWYAADYETRSRAARPRSLDKEYVRRHYAAIGYTGEGAPPRSPTTCASRRRGYIEAYETVTGRAFVPDTRSRSRGSAGTSGSPEGVGRRPRAALARRRRRQLGDDIARRLDPPLERRHRDQLTAALDLAPEVGPVPGHRPKGMRRRRQVWSTRSTTAWTSSRHGWPGCPIEAARS